MYNTTNCKSIETNVHSGQQRERVTLHEWGFDFFLEYIISIVGYSYCTSEKSTAVLVPERCWNLVRDKSECNIWPYNKMCKNMQMYLNMFIFVYVYEYVYIFMYMYIYVIVATKKGMITHNYI